MKSVVDFPSNTVMLIDIVMYTQRLLTAPSLHFCADISNCKFIMLNYFAKFQKRQHIQIKCQRVKIYFCNCISSLLITNATLNSPSSHTYAYKWDDIRITAEISAYEYSDEVSVIRFENRIVYTHIHLARWGDMLNLFQMARNWNQAKMFYKRQVLIIVFSKNFIRCMILN